MWLKLLNRIRSFFGCERIVPKEEWIPKLVHDCASLELQVGQSLRLNGVPGMHGVVRLSGNSIPTFQYTVFDQELMEFIIMKAHLSLPGVLAWELSVLPTENSPETVPMKEEYQEPFINLARHLYVYFPFPMPEAANVRTYEGF